MNITKHTVIALSLLTGAVTGCGGDEAQQLSDATHADVTSEEGDSAATEAGALDTSPGDSSQPEDTQAPDVESLESRRSFCGQPEYNWLPTDAMGQIMDRDPRPFYSLSKDLVTALLADSGFSDILDLKYDVEVIAIRYTSQDRGVATDATALLGVPIAPEGETLSTPIIAFLAGTSGFSEACAGSNSEGNALAAILYASQGYVAMLPDYLGKAGFGGDDGLAHPYVVSEAAAIATWDGVRGAEALLAERGEEVQSDGQVFLWGGSQGGHAAYAADRLAPHYAPEFEVVGTIATVAPSDLMGQAEVAVDSLGPAAVGLLASCITLAEWYGMWDRVDEIVRDDDEMPLASWLREQMKTVCFPDLSVLGVETTEDAFNPLFLAALQDGSWAGYEDWQCVFKENSLSHQSVPRLNATPTLTVLATEDSLVNLAVERKSHQALCEQGYALTQIECDQANHTDGTSWSVREQFAWMRERLKGEPHTETCAPVTPVCCSGSPAETCTPAP